MAPEKAIEEAEIGADRPGQEARSATSTPETTLVTPVSRDMARAFIKEESPTPTDSRKRTRSPTAVASGTSNVQPKKRMRVAFA